MVLDLIDTERIVFGLQSTSFCKDDKQVLFLDYDDKTLDEVKKDIKRLQKKYDLPDIHIYVSSNKDGVERYHAFCFTPLEFSEHIRIIMDADIDFNYKKIFLNQHKSTLRFSAKNGQIPKFLMTIKGKSKNREIIDYAKKVLDKLLLLEKKNIKENGI